MKPDDKNEAPGGLRRKLHEIIFEADTPSGTCFDAASEKKFTTQACPECILEGQGSDATHCKHSGAKRQLH
jgi:hypothetical protein